MKIVKNNVSAPKGFSALGKVVGIKPSGKLDFGVIYSEVIANAAALYTQNQIKGAPLLVTKKHLQNGKAQAIVINSGIANVCTGKKGYRDAQEMAELAALELGIKKTDVAVSSTGLIGAFLPMERMREGMKGIKSQLSKESEIAQAILTIDKAKKEIAVRIDNFTIGAIAKGSGMIHPNMATMLSFITTDAEISSKALRAFLKHSVDLSFNMISVDRDTSTSDMAVILANGLAGKVDAKKFQQGLDFVCMYLAKEIAKDGEGSTRLIKVNVKNAVTENDARKVAKAIISSNLVKCAVFGNDPNWGRILCAIGNSGAHFTEGKIDVYFDEHKLVGDGMAKGFDKATVKEIMKNDELLVTIDLKEGKHEATAYGCDMSLEYVKLSAQYKT